MAEIKTTFIKGRMNKDLDERLLPKGEYRDARNVEVSTSEGSNVGTVQNIVGNSRVDNLMPSGFKCVGSIADEANNKLYWLASGLEKDIIAEYDVSSGGNKLVFVDANKRNSKACLKFGQKLITGINIIDDFILFTDGESEPKKINIKRSKIGTIDIDSHTLLIKKDTDNIADNVGLVKEENITVIKKRPSKTLTVNINKKSQSKEKGIFEKTFPRFSYRYKYSDNEYSAFGPFTSPVFSANFTDDFNSLNFYNVKQGHNTAMINTIESIDLSGIIDSATPRDVVSVDILFKREDSNVVYTVATLSFEEISKTRNIDESFGKYTVTTENIFAAVNSNQILRSFDNVPKTAVAQEIVGNRVIYANYTQGYNVGEVKVDSGYSVRNTSGATFSQGGLESLKSQRDYQVGVVFGDKYGRETPVFTSDQGSVTVPWYNSNVTDGPSFLSSLILTSSIPTPTPEWAKYYKFYVKEVSGAYYNLLMDKVYLPSSSTDYENKEDHVYLSFASSDINKVSDEDYIILKKVSESSEKHVTDANRYKVLDVSAEAPDAIAFMYLDVGVVSNNDDNSNLANADGNGLFQDANTRIDSETDVIEIDKSTWTSFGYPALRGAGVETDTDNIYIAWKKAEPSGRATHSRRYKAVSVETGDSLIRLKLEKEITKEDATLAAGANASSLNANLEFTVFRKEKREGEDFSGKFFVKIIADEALKSNFTTSSNASSSRFISSSQNLFWWANALSLDSQDNIGLNSQFFPSYGTAPDDTPDELSGVFDGSTNSAVEWDELLLNYNKAMFIDHMYMAGASLDSTGYAKNTGQGVVGSGISYPEIKWSTEAEGNWDIAEDGSWSVSDIEQDNWTDNIVNGMSGIVEVGQGYVSGPGAWKKDLYSNEIDTVYGEDDGGNFMHFSFFAPGKDLHDDDFNGANDLANADISGENSVARMLKGIWGGGAFTKANGEGFGDLGDVVEFEGNYINEQAAAESPGEGIGQGYDIEYKEQHERQWDPTYSTSNHDLNGPSIDTNEELEEFIENIAIGSKFKFSADTSEEIYTIIDVSIKHIYNHTPWRSRWINDSVNGISRANDSVEEAAVAWATAKESGVDQIPDATLNNLTPGEFLAKRIVDFGKASNRRTCYIIRLDKNPASGDYAYNPQTGGSGFPDLDDATKMQFINSSAQAESGLAKNISALFETEPKDSLDLNLFYEASQAIPTYISSAEEGVELAPVGCRVEMVALPQAKRGAHVINENLILSSWSETVDGQIYFTVINEKNLEEYTISTEEDGVIDQQIDAESYQNPGLSSYNWAIPVGKTFNYANKNGLAINYSGVRVRFYRPDGSYTSCRLLDNNDSINNAGSSILEHGNRYAFVIDKNIDSSLQTGIDWFNCYSFGNGVESNRIRDDFNSPSISNGARVSTTIEEPYPFEEERKFGLIYSGLYNGSSGLNNLNQFITAEKITKDLNPTYGSIQKLFSRRSDLIAFCEDRVIKILANKDALFNADGNVNLVATENVLGQASPFVGEFGISKNPESFAKESYRAYFTDKSRGAVLRLSMDGITPISEAGMHDYFRDNIPNAGTLLGTFDEYKRQYNISFGEQLYNNLLSNSYLANGETLSSSDQTFQIVQGSNLNSGEDFTLVNINSLYLDDNTSPVENETFSASTQIYNWPAIYAGDMSSYYDATVTSAASLEYTLTTSTYGITNADETIDETTTEDFPAVLANYPQYGGHGGYISRNETNALSTGMSADPFSDSGYDQYHSNCKYYRSSSTFIKWWRTFYDDQGFQGDPIQISEDINGILFTGAPANNAQAAFFFPYSAEISGNFYTSNNYNPSNFNDGAWGATNGSVTSAQIEIGGDAPSGGAYCRNVYNGETIIVKLNYRLRKQWASSTPDWAEGAGDITVAICDGTTEAGSIGICSNISEVNGANIQAGNQAMLVTNAYALYGDSGSPNASGTIDSWNHILNGVTGGGDEFYGYASDALINYSSSSYTLLSTSQITSSLTYDDLVQIGNIYSSEAKLTYSTNHLNFNPPSNVYSSGSSNYTIEEDLWEWDNSVSYDQQGLHYPRYSKVRTVIFQFRLFDQDDPWTPKKIISHVNAKISCKTNSTDGVLITGCAMWKQQPLTSTGNFYVSPYTTTTFIPGADAVYGFLSDESEDFTLTGSAATTQYDTDPDLSSLEVTTGNINTIGTQTTVSGITYIPQGVVGDIEQPNSTTPGWDPNVGTNGGIPAWAEVVHYLPSNFPSGNAFVNLIAANEANYGLANPGQNQTYTYGSASNPQTGYYRTGTSNGVVEYNQYSYSDQLLYSIGAPMNSIQTGPQAGATYSTQAQGTLSQGAIEIGGGDGQSCGFTYDHPAGEALFEEGNWYLVDLEYDGSPTFSEAANGQFRVNGGSVGVFGCLDPGIAELCYGETQDDAPQSSYYPYGAYGQVVNYPQFGEADLLMLPTTATEYGSGDKPVLRAVFKAQSNTSLNFQELKIRGYSINPAVTFKSIVVINISQQADNGGFSEFWQTNSTIPLPNALSPLTTYYSNDQWVWELPQQGGEFDQSQQLLNNISYEFNDEFIETNSNIYTVEYKINPTPNNLFSGNYTLAIMLPVQEDGLSKKIVVDGNLGVDVAQGVHKFTFDTSNFPSFNQLIDNGSVVSYFTDALSQNTNGVENGISIQGYGQNFNMALDYFKIYSGSLVLSGGNIGGWNLNYIDYDLNVPNQNDQNLWVPNSTTPITSEPFVYFENEMAIFEDAPIGTQLYQTLDQDINLGEKYNIKFNFVNNGQFYEVYYFTPNSVQGNATGFRLFNQANYVYNFAANFSVSKTVEIVDMSNTTNFINSEGTPVAGSFTQLGFDPSRDMVGALVIRIAKQDNSLYPELGFSDPATFNGTIDNITFTQVNTEYVVNETISYSEDVKGWVSFKDFTNNSGKGLESGLSVSKKYFTFNNSYLYEHYSNSNYNLFYGLQRESSIKVILNDSPGTIKEFKTLNYEGTQGRFNNPTLSSSNFLTEPQQGWYASSVFTNLGKGKVKEFIEKEGKWYNYISGDDTLLNSLENLNVQGLGTISSTPILTPGQDLDVE